MEKFSEFRIVSMERNICIGSVYFNKHMLINQSKVASYFELYFAKNVARDLTPYLYGNVPSLSYDKIFADYIMRKIGAMAECMYEEATYNQQDKNRSYSGFLIDHEENKRVLKYIITCKLLLVYYSGMVHLYSVSTAETKLEKLMYEAALYWKVDDVFDYIITRGEKIKEPEKEKSNNSPRVPSFTTFIDNNEEEKKEPQYKDDYEYNRNKEITLFQSILKYSMFFSGAISIRGILLNTYRNAYDRFEQINYDLNNPNFNILNIIKDTMLKISMVKLDLDVKDKVLKSLQKIMDDEMFKEENLFINMQSALEYSEHNRPNHTCEKLINAYKDKYSFTGKVYHGFRDRYGYKRSAEDILKDYKDGFISCSKDIRVARNFANSDYEEDCRGFGGVIEIMIKEEDVAIDIEQILRDEYAKNSMLYCRLFDCYIKEREVLVKMPVISYNVLYRDEVEKIIRETYEKEKESKEEA